MTRMAVVVILWTFALAVAVSAQETWAVHEDPIPMMRAAAEAVRAELPAGRHILDTSDEAARSVRSLGEVMGLASAPLEKVRVCPGPTPASCRLEEAAAIL